MKWTTRVKKALNWKNLTIIGLIIVAIILLGYFFGPTLVEFFSDMDRIKELIDSAGVFGPLIFIILQVAQVVLAPIPGNVVGAVGGIIFGWWGLLLTIIGSILGMMIVVAISRKFGRPFVEKFFSKEQIKKFDFLLEGRGATFALFLIFLLPFFPDDLIGYVSGLTKIRFRNIIIVSVVGRLPMHILTNFFGAQVFEGNWIIIVIMLVIVGAIASILYIKRDWLYELVKKENDKENEKDKKIKEDKKKNDGNK